jgi:hypothetical protein
MHLDSSGNLGVGVTPSAAGTYKLLQLPTAGQFGTKGATSFLTANAYLAGAGTWTYASDNVATRYAQDGGVHHWSYAATGSTGAGINFTQAMTLNASGNLLLGSTAVLVNSDERFTLDAGANYGLVIRTTAGTTAYPQVIWNSATTGDNLFVSFATETSYTIKGSISFNRAGGLVMYNQTSDYRAKDISGPITNSGALIDSVPVYMGTMKGATQERPMFIAHETPAYAHTGGKDAVDADGKPVYQQMDASALIPVMWAEIQSLRKRLAAANI